MQPNEKEEGNGEFGDENIDTLEVCQVTANQLRQRKLRLACQLNRLDAIETESSVDLILKRHNNEESRITQFIKKEQISQEKSFRSRLDAIRERRSDSFDDQRTVSSIKDHLTDFPSKRHLFREDRPDPLLDLSEEDSGEDS